MKAILTTLAILIFSVSALAYDEVKPQDKTPTDYEKITVAIDAVSRLNEVFRNASTAVFVTVETNNIRYRIDGGDPDANDGHLIVAASYQNLWIYDKAAVRALRMIAIGGAATVIVTYYKE